MTEAEIAEQIEIAATTIPVLHQQCAACNGSGRVYNPAWQQWFAENSGTPRDTMDAWDAYYGRKLYPEPGDPPLAEQEELDCPSCDGRGRIPTTAGMQVLDLLAVMGR